MPERNALLVQAYRRGIRRIKGELTKLVLTDMSRAHTLAALEAIGEVLAEIDEESAAWVREEIAAAVKDGVIEAILGLGVVSTREAAAKIVKFNRANQALISALIEDTQADLLNVTNNISRRTKTAIRQAASLSFRDNMAAGINGRKTISRDMLAEMRRTLGTAVETGIIDAGGRRWKPETYVDMVTRTKTAEASRQAAVNEAVQRGAFYGTVSRHRATDACRNYEGKIVKLVRDVPGNYPYIGDISRRDLFHPNCRHTVTPLRNPTET